MRLLLLSLGLGALKDIMRHNARLGFIPTAGEPYTDRSFIRDERKRLLHMGYQITDIDMSTETALSLQEQLNQVDALFVAGGNSFFLMQQIRTRGLTQVLSHFVSTERPYVGSSAGAVICGPTLLPFEALDDTSAAPELQDKSGLDWVRFTVLPHYGQPSYYKAHLAAMKKYAAGNEFVPLCDDEAVWATSPDTYEFRPSALVLDPDNEK